VADEKVKGRKGHSEQETQQTEAGNQTSAPAAFRVHETFFKQKSIREPVRPDQCGLDRHEDDTRNNAAAAGFNGWLMAHDSRGADRFFDG
jgi:hypothetical protein